MSVAANKSVIFIRHATVKKADRLYGRTDAPIAVPDPRSLAAIRKALSHLADSPLFSSPASRCRQTGQALWPDRRPQLIEGLWEQDFGDWEGKAFTELPDIGEKTTAQLAAHRPPDGESFEAMAARVQSALSAIYRDKNSSAIILCHAGTIRAALGSALGNPASGLKFAIANLSVTSITMHDADSFTIHSVGQIHD